MRRKLAWLVLFTFGGAAHAAAEAVTPTAAGYPVLSVNSLDAVTPAQLDLVRLAEEDALRDDLGMPPRFAVPERVAVTPLTHGTWEDLGNGAGFGLTDLDFERRLADRDGVRRAFARLAAEDREVLLLRDIEGFHGDEAATLLEIGLPALKSRLHRARLRLVAELRGTGGVR